MRHGHQHWARARSESLTPVLLWGSADPCGGLDPGRVGVEAAGSWYQKCALPATVGRGAMGERMGELETTTRSDRSLMPAGVQAAGDCGVQQISDLTTVNEIIATLNQAADVRGALEGALGRTVELMGLESGLVYLRSVGDGSGASQAVYGLAAHRGLPPALLGMGPEAWGGRCRCQQLCEAGQLNQAVNVVSCSRLAALGDGALGLAVHASVALRSGPKVMGILNVIAEDRESFAERSLALLTNIGAHLGVALERALLYDLVRERRVEEQAGLLSLSNQLLGRLDLDDVLDCVVDEARHLLNADASAVLLPQGESGELVFRAATGWHASPAEFELSVGVDPNTGPGLVMQTRQPLILSDVAAGAPETCSWAGEIVASEGFRAHALVPMSVDARAVGVLMLDSRQPRSMDDDDVRLLQLIANQGALAIEQARMHREEVERRRLERELEVARSIQLGLLPKWMPVLQGWEFAVHYEAARQVGGDFYDAFALPGESGEYGIVVADVADKGVPAALIMAAGRTLIRGIALDGKRPAAVLEIANRLLLEDNDSGLFVTCVFARLNPATASLTFANGGHMRPLHVTSGGGVEELKSAGIALGVFGKIALEEVQITLAPGDTVVLYADGVTDAVDASLESFGMARLRETLGTAASAGQSSPVELVSAVRQAVEDFVSGAEQADDLTIFALGRSQSAPI